MEYYAGTIRITNPRTLQSWKDKGWFQSQLDKGYIFAEGCGRFRFEVCQCSKCRKKIKINKMKLTEEQASQVLYGDIWDEENGILLYERVSEKITDFDKEKNSADKYIIIKDVKTGKKYGAILGDSPWIDQNEANAEEEWEEIIPKKKK